MINKMDHVAIIVSKEENLDFYRKLGFEEFRRINRESKGDILVMMKNGTAVLEFFIRNDAPLRHCSPEAYGCRHVAFEVKSVTEILEVLKEYESKPVVTTPEGSKIVFITDNDGQPIEFIERP